MKKVLVIAIILLLFLSSLLVTIVVALPEYTWSEGDIYNVAGYGETPDISSYGVRESRDIVYHNGSWYFYSRYKKDGDAYYGYMMVNTSNFTDCDDPYYVTPDNAMGDGGWPNWAVHWYNKYTDELWFLWNKAYTSASRTGGAYLTTYNFTTQTWSFNTLWKSPEYYNGRNYAPMFVYQPMVHEFDGKTRLIMPMGLCNKTSGDVGYANATIYYSDDFGNTWSCKHNVTDEYIFVPGQPVDDVEENSIIELPNGTLRMMIRTQDYDNANSYYLWHSYSFNHGMNWTNMEKDENIPLAITKNLWRNATIFGRNVYILYANHRPEGYATISSWCWARRRSNVSMRVSFDGETWSDPHIIHPNEFGYGYQGWAYCGNYSAYGAFITHNNTFYCTNYWTDNSVLAEAGCGKPTDTIMWTVNLNPKILITNPSPANNSENISIGSGTVSVLINDTLGEGIDWTLECSSGDTTSGSGEANGTKSLSVSLLPSTTYTLWANASGAWLNHSYTFTTEDNIQFVDINGGSNGTSIYDSTPVFNWSRMNGAAKYHLQVANDSGFTQLVVNLTDINEGNYPTYFSQNTTTVSFELPTGNALPEYKKYYCRVRAYIIQ